MLGDRLKSLRQETGKTQEMVANALKITRANYSHFENNRNQPDGDTLIALANYYKVSTDYLLGRSDKRHYYDLTEKDEKDVQKQLESTLNDLSNAGTLSFMKNGGTEISDEDAELLKASLENVIRQSKIIAKKKFTPKKYRDSTDE